MMEAVAPPFQIFPTNQSQYSYSLTVTNNSVALGRERTIPYRPSDRLLSAKLVPIFAMSRSQRCGPPTAVIHEAEWAQFQTHYFSENLVAPGIEPGPLDL
jgi:hypothetical protein